MLWHVVLWRRQCTLNFKNFNSTSGGKTCGTKVVRHTNIDFHITFEAFLMQIKNVMGGMLNFGGVNVRLI